MVNEDVVLSCSCYCYCIELKTQQTSGNKFRKITKKKYFFKKVHYSCNINGCEPVYVHLI